MISLFFKSTNIQGIRDHPGAYGDVILHPQKALHKMELNGECTLEVTLLKQLDDVWEVIDTGDVFAAPVPWSEHRQLFRCYEYDKDSANKAVFYCRHIVFDLRGYTIIDSRPTMQNGQGALAVALQKTPFTSHSNITAVSTAYWVRKQVTEALWSEDENSFASRWGGEYLCDNYDLYINDKIGTDRGARIERRRNLEAIKVNKSEGDVVTRIIPVGYDGITLDGDTPWVDSQLIDAYPVRHDSVIAFDDIKYDPEDEEAYHTLPAAQAAMTAKCVELYIDGIDKPDISYSVSMVDLSKLDIYKDYKILETVSIGDTVHVKDDELDIDATTRVMAYEYDSILEEYTALTLDAIRPSYFNQTSNVQSTVNAILNSNGSVNGAAIAGVIDAFKTKIRAQRNIEQLQAVRAILFEDTVDGSPTYGAMSLGTQGFAIASEMLPDGSDWDWRTFGTSQGFVADLMVIGKIIGQCAEIGLDNATFLLGERDAQGVISDPVMSYQNGVFELDVSGTSVESELDEMKAEIDGKIETWYQDTDPSLRWATIAAQTQHTGDLWYKTTDQTTWRWTGTVWTQQDAPAAVFDAIDGKSAIYVSQPTPPYEVGDLWAQGSNGDLLRCTTARASGSYTASDWTKASKYTDDTAVTNFIQGEYADDIEDIRGQVDAKAETWYQAADPAADWTTTDAKTQHTGDLWYKTTDQTTWRWTGTAWTKQDAPAAVFDAIDGKSAIYVSQPTPPYEVGDLWAQGSSGDIMRCTTARASGSYTANDWTKASKYTDDTAITNFITGDYADDLEDIRGQVDAKAETWYQAADPSTAWTTTAIKTQHTGDLWYKTTDQTTWRWTGTAWTKQDAPAAVFDAIDGKSAIYVSQPIPPYEVGDLWVLAADTTISSLPYTKGTVLVATTARASGSFVVTDWTQKIDIATWLSNQINTGTGIVDAIRVIIDSTGLTLKNIIGTNVFYADVSGNLTLAGTLQAAKGTFLGEVRNYESNGYLGLSITGSQLKFYSKNYQDNFIGGIENKGKGTSETDKLRLHIYADSGDQLSIGNNTSGVMDQISMSDNGNTWILAPRNGTGVIIAGYDGDTNIISAYQASGNRYTDIHGNLNVTGSKNRAIKTKDYGWRCMAAYETATPLFGDVGEGKIGDGGQCCICLDPIFVQTIEDPAKYRYQVFTQVYEGSITKIERFTNHFSVEGSPGTSFAWEVKSRQIDAEERLKRNYDIKAEIDVMDAANNATAADQYIAEQTAEIIDGADDYLQEYKEKIL